MSLYRYECEKCETSIPDCMVVHCVGCDRYYGTCHAQKERQVVGAEVASGTCQRCRRCTECGLAGIETKTCVACSANICGPCHAADPLCSGCKAVFTEDFVP